MMTADEYREIETILETGVAERGEDVVNECLVAAGINQSIDEFRYHLSYMIMQLEITRETRTHILKDHQVVPTLAGGLQDVGSVSNLKENHMSEQATQFPGKGLTDTSQPVAQPNTYGFMRRILDSWNTPLKVVAGPKPAPTDNRITPEVLGDDAELLKRTTHVRLKGERMSQFHARVGLGASQILQMSYSEIKHFCDVAEESAEQLPKYFEEKPLPKKLRITLI